MCRCAERRAAGLRFVAAVARGDSEAAKTEATFVLKTSAVDLAKASKLARAHTRLKR